LALAAQQHDIGLKAMYEAEAQKAGEQVKKLEAQKDALDRRFDRES
jgi:hypothetical protein